MHFGGLEKTLADQLDGHSSDATASGHLATKAREFNASNCLSTLQKEAALRDNVYGYCLANCNTMALERKQIALEFSGACINPDACIGNLYLI